MQTRSPAVSGCACPVCDATLSVTRRSWEFRCPACGFLASTLEAGIGPAGDPNRLDEERRETGLAALRRRNFETILDRLQTVAAPEGSVLLDVGCAHGWFLDAAARRGYAVHGVEPDERIGHRTAQRGHDVTIGFFPDDLAPAQQYDVISFNDVFEHLDNPRHALAACRSRLRPNGLLVINLPSSRGVFFRVAALLDRMGARSTYERLWQKGFPSPHRSYFHPDALARLAQREGFDEVYRGTLDSFERAGLWQRLNYDRNASRWLAVMLWIAISAAAPLLRRLPADISFHVFRRADREVSLTSGQGTSVRPGGP